MAAFFYLGQLEESSLFFMVFSLYYFQVEKKSKDYIAFQGKIFPIGISKSKENIGKKGG